MAKQIHWKFRRTAKAPLQNLCNTRKEHRDRDGSVILKPVRKMTGKYSGTCMRCHGIGSRAGLVDLNEDY